MSMDVRTHDQFLKCRDRIYDALVGRMQFRGNDLAWIEHERQVVAMTANEWALSHDGCSTVTVEDVAHVEQLAVGHVDYGPKLSLYVAELVYRGGETQ